MGFSVENYSNEITSNSIQHIENGAFVTPSRMEAESYAGNGKVYEQVVNIDDVVWIDPTQGQYAKIDADSSESAFSMPETRQYSLPWDDGEYMSAVERFGVKFRCEVSVCTFV